MAFNRQVELLVGTKNNEGLKITQLKIDFEVKKTTASGTKTNNAKIKVYNCNEGTAKALCTAGNHCILKAGYEDEVVTTILLGDIVKGEKKKDGVNTVIELEVADGRNQVMQGNISVSYGKDTDVATVVQAFTDVLGFPVKGTENIPSGEKYAHGYSFIGMATDGLKQVLNKVALTYTIQNEMLYIKGPDQSIDNLGLRLTKDTGLLTLPTHISDKTDSSTIDQTTSNKWKFNTMLFPQLMPGAVCKVESSTLNANIMIEEATFKGTNFDGDFIVEVKGVEK